MCAGDDTGLYIAEVSSSLIWDVRTQRHRWSPVTTMHAYDETEKETPISTNKPAHTKQNTSTGPSPVAGFPLDIKAARALSANWAFSA